MRDPVQSEDREIVAEVERNKREVYRVAIGEYRGHRFVDLRIWYRDNDTDELRPAKGCAIKGAALAGVIEGLQAAAVRLAAIEAEQPTP